MHSLDDVSLDKFGGNCTNALHGTWWASQPKINVVNSPAVVVWQSDNTTKEAKKENVTQSWTVTLSAKLQIATKATIQLADTITIPNVAFSPFSLTIGTEDTEPVTAQKSLSFSGSWNVIIPPGVQIVLVKEEAIETVQQVYYQKYGLSTTSKIGTQGDEYNGSRNWAYDANHYLNKPEGKMSLEGYSETPVVTFKLMRAINNKTTEEILKPSEAVHTGPNNSAPTKIVYAVPGPQ